MMKIVVDWMQAMHAYKIFQVDEQGVDGNNKTPEIRQNPEAMHEWFNEIAGYALRLSRPLRSR